MGLIRPETIIDGATMAATAARLQATTVSSGNSPAMDCFKRIHTPGRSTDSTYRSTTQRSNDYYVGGTQYPSIDRVGTPLSYVNRVGTRSPYIDRVGTTHPSIERGHTPHHSIGRVDSPSPTIDRARTPHHSSYRVASPRRSIDRAHTPHHSSYGVASPGRSFHRGTNTPRRSSEMGTPSFLLSKTLPYQGRFSDTMASPLLSSEMIASPYCSSEKIVDGETVSSVFAVDGRCNRDSNGITQRDLEAHPLENGRVTEGSSKPLNVSALKLVGDMLTDNSLPRSESGNAEDELRPKDPRLGSLGSIDRKLRRWTRSSGSKSSGAESSEGKAEVQDKIANPVETQSGDPSGCVRSAALSESSRKKQRVKFVEGLVEYEKRKAGVADDSATRNGGVDCCSIEASCSDLPNLADKSFPGFASLSTPSSVGYSSSPGIEKRFLDTSTTDNATCRSSGSQNAPPNDIFWEKDIDLESLDATSIANLSSSVSKLVKEDSSTVRAASLNKLQVWKGSITKALEMTESEIDSLENELKLLESGTGTSGPCPVTPSSLLGNTEVKTSECQVVGPDLISQVADLQFVSSVNPTGKGQENAMEEVPDPLGGEGADSPGTVTSKLLGPLTSSKDGVKYNEGSVDLETITSITLEPEDQICSSESPIDMSLRGDGGAKLYDLINASNKECAAIASDLFKKLMPSNQCGVDLLRTSSVSNGPNDSLMKEKFVARKQLLKFKEKVQTLKFMVLRHQWRDDMRLHSVRKNQAKSQTVRGSNKKHRSFDRSRFSPGGNSDVVPSAEVINFTKKLLSGSQFKLQRKALRMPAMVLDNKEKVAMQFVSKNGLVEDPCAVEKERSLINPWTTEEKEIFIDKLVTLGKDFRKIASFHDHKTTADCVEFYYKNHKSDCFREAMKKLKLAGQGQGQGESSSAPKHFAKKKLKLAGQGESSSAPKHFAKKKLKQRNREADPASLDMLGAVSAVAANPGDNTKYPKNYASSSLLAAGSNYTAPQLNDDSTERIDNSDALDRSCNPVESHPDSNSQKVVRRPLTPEVVDDGSCSDDSCDGMYSADWTEEEKLLFVQALKAHGKDFAMISKSMKTKSQNMCGAFFTKTRGLLGLDNICSSSGKDKLPVSDGAGCGWSDREDACGMLNGSIICSEKSETKLDDGLVSAHKVDVEINNSSEVDEDAVSRSNAEVLIKAVPDVVKDMDEVNLDTCESNPADTIKVLPERNRSEGDSGAGKIELEKPEPAQEHLIADVSIGESDMELNSVDISKTASAGSWSPLNCCEDGDTGSGFVLEQPVACEIFSDHNLTVSGIEGETIASKDSTACLVTDLDKKQLQSENSSACEYVNVGATVCRTLLVDRPDQDMNASKEASNVAIDENTLVEQPEKKQLTGLELHPSSGSLSTSFDLDVSLAQGNCTTDTPPSSHCARMLEQDARSIVGFEQSSFEQCINSADSDGCNNQKSDLAVSSCVESWQLPAAQFIHVAATGNEISGDICSKNPAFHQTLAEVDGNELASLNLLQGSFIGSEKSETELDGSDGEDACGLLNGAVIGSEKPETELDDGLVCGQKMDVEINNCSEVDAEELMEEVPVVDKDMVDVSTGESTMELNSVDVCKTGSDGSWSLLAPPLNSVVDGDTGSGFALEQQLNLTVSGTEGQTSASKDSTACLVTDLEKKQLQSENSSACEDVNVGATVCGSLLVDGPDQDMNASKEASNVAIDGNTLVEHLEKKQLTVLELHPSSSSGSLSNHFDLNVSPPSTHCERMLEQGVQSTVGFEKQCINSGDADDNCNKLKSALAVSPCIESCQVPASQFIPPAATRNEMSGNICSENPALLQTIAEVDGYARAGLNLLQKCNSLEANSLASRFSFLSLTDKRSDHGGNTTLDLGGPCKSGEVKLFGKILTITRGTEANSVQPDRVFSEVEEAQIPDGEAQVPEEEAQVAEEEAQAAEVEAQAAEEAQVAGEGGQGYRRSSRNRRPPAWQSDYDLRWPCGGH